MADTIFDTPRFPRLSSPAATAALGLLVVLLVVWRIGAPSDIYDNDQPTPVAHVVDVAVNGNWQMQSNPAGKLITKPPMYPWLGALCVRATGLIREWVVKLPLLGGFVVITLVVLDLARRTLGWPLACLAAAFWASNFHVFKLMYTARTDMLVTMWVAVALWSAERQRHDWTHNRSKSHPVHIVIFWLATAGGLLTKGPVALLAVGWWLSTIIYHRTQKRCRPVWQLAAMTVGLALVLLWLLPAQAAYPDWWRSMFSHEVTERITGTGSGASRHTPMLAIPGYFFARFAPWSLLVVIGALGLRWRARALRWALVWMVAVLFVFMIPAGKRADYILPAYIGAALIGAFAVAWAQYNRGWHRVAVHIVLGGITLAGIAAGIYCWWLPSPPRLVFEPAAVIADPWHTAVHFQIMAAGLLSLVAGIVGLVWVHRRRYIHGGFAGAFVVAAILGMYQSALSPAARSRSGDYIIATARYVRGVRGVRNVAGKEPLPVACYQIGSIPLQALLGANELTDESVLSRLEQADGGILVTNAKAWAEIAERYSGRFELYLTTPPVSSASLRLMVLRIFGPYLK